MAPTNTDPLRRNIDAGRTAGKVAAFDPAVAPLGTDEEAAGTPPSVAAVAAAQTAERRDDPLPPAAAGPEVPHARPPAQFLWIGLAAGAVVGALLIFVLV